MAPLDDWRAWRRQNPLGAAAVTAILFAALMSTLGGVSPAIAGAGGVFWFVMFGILNLLRRAHSDAERDGSPAKPYEPSRQAWTEGWTENWPTMGVSSAFVGALIGVNVALGEHSVGAAFVGGAIGGLAFLAFLLVLRRWRQR